MPNGRGQFDARKLNTYDISRSVISTVYVYFDECQFDAVYYINILTITDDIKNIGCILVKQINFQTLKQ